MHLLALTYMMARMGNAHKQHLHCQVFHSPTLSHMPIAARQNFLKQTCAADLLEGDLLLEPNHSILESATG